MKKFLHILFFIGFVSFGQESVTKHVVLKGETISQIAQNHKTSTSVIYRLNPDAQDGIVENQVLLIPELLPQIKNTITHVVCPNETLFGLATKYNVKVEVIQDANALVLDNGLKEGQTLIIPQQLIQKQELFQKQELIQKQESSISKNTYLVQEKETLFSIARKFNVSVTDLEKINAEILKEGLKTGQQIALPNKKKTLGGSARIINSDTEFYVVGPKETKYAIAKKFCITIDQLESQNPEIVNGLLEGTKLAINVKQITPVNDNEELMIALAEKQVVVEKTKAKTVELESLKEKLNAQKEINQKIIKVNGLNVSLKEIDNTKLGSVERLKLVLDANKNVQDILITKLDSLIYTMNSDLVKLKKTKFDDSKVSKELEKKSYRNVVETNKLSFQLKKDLAVNRRVYSGLMNKVVQIAAEENLEYKKKIRASSKVHFSLDELKKMQQELKERDDLNDAMLSKIDSLENEKEMGLKKSADKAILKVKK
jgi:LysM repeat protein